ncbi:MAG: AlpA family phage regulatory protein [Pseudomonadota bacterium]
MLSGLCLLGRFPKKLKFQGRAIGWRRSEVLDWIARDLAVMGNAPATFGSCARQHPGQACLPLECVASTQMTRTCHAQRRNAGCKAPPRAGR